MEKYMKVLLAGFGCATLALAGTFIGYWLTAEPAAVEKPGAEATEAFVMGASIPEEYEPGPSAAPLRGPEARIEARTKIVYEYVYPEDGVIETTEEVAPYFLLNMDEERLRSVFTDWEIASFSPAQVVMRKEMEGSSAQHYIVGEQDGYVSVFYQKPINGTLLKEITSTPVSALSEEERERLAQGVLVSGETELVRVLEDYSS